MAKLTQSKIIGPDESYVGATYSVPPPDRVHLAESEIVNCLNEFAESNKRRSAWHAPLGIFLSVVSGVFFASEIRNFGVQGLDATILAVYILAAIVSGIWLAWSLVVACKKPKTADQIVASLKAKAIAYTEANRSDPVTEDAVTKTGSSRDNS